MKSSPSQPRLPKNEPNSIFRQREATAQSSLSGRRLSIEPRTRSEQHPRRFIITREKPRYQASASRYKPVCVQNLHVSAPVLREAT